MKSGSHLALLKRKPSQRDIVEEEPDTNVIAVDFKGLKLAEENLHMGDPYFCKNCNCCLSSHSVFLTKEEFKAKANDVERQIEEEKKAEPMTKKKIMAMVLTPEGKEKEKDKIWACEFCGANNMVTLEEEEIPSTEDVVYLLHAAKTNPSKDTNTDITTIFCIDNSGSMSVTHEVKGEEYDPRYGMSEEEYEMLKQFIEAGADQYLPGQQKGTTFISRKECVLKAIESQLLELKTEHPNRKVGLVTFNDEVCIVGDGKNSPEIIAGDKLYNKNLLKEISQGVGSKLITASVKDSAEDLIKKFKKLQECGKTALGPALLVSLQLAIQGKQGSRVILCTDGLANIGLGEMDTKEGLTQAEQFYIDLAQHAKENGVSISIMSIKGEGCKLDILGQVADLTSGSLTRVDPNEMGSKFASMMKQEVIGTQVDVKLRLHRGMKFRNEAVENLKENASLYEKNIGNVTASTELTFEYEMRSDEELVELGIDVAKLQTVPFQAQIIYTSSNGDQLMRVINQTLKTTTNQAEAEAKLNVNLLAARALQQQAELASRGKFQDSEQVGYIWGTYLENRVYKNNNKKSSNVVDRYRQQSENLTRVTNRKMHTVAESPPQKKGGYGTSDRELHRIKVSEALFGGNKGDNKEGGRGGKMSRAEEEDEDYEALHSAKNCTSHFAEEEYC